MTGFNKTSFDNNLQPSFADGQSFFSVLGVFFPTATGKMQSQCATVMLQYVTAISQ